MSYIIRFVTTAIERFKLSEERSKLRMRFAYLVMMHREGK
jgi:hypothetical protein